MVFHYLRYLLVISLNHSKTFFNSSQSKWKTCKIKTLQHFISWYTYLIFFIVLLIIYFIIVMIIWLSFNPSYCTNLYIPNDPFVPVPFLINRFVNLGILIVFSILFAIISCIDPYLNCSRTGTWKERTKKFFLKDDPFCFRLEVAFYYAFAPINGILIFIVSILFLINTGGGTTVSVIVMDLFPNFILMLIIVWFPLTITITKYLKEKFQKYKGSSSDEVTMTLKNPELHDLLKEFAKSEWSVENVLVYDDIVEYEKEISKEKASNIIYQYLTSGAPLQVNLPKREIDPIIEKMNKDEIDIHLFEGIKQTLIQNLMDTYSRFIYSSDYESYITKVQTMNKMI